MMVEERAANILESAIQEFIRTGEPISSGGLFQRYNFGIRPASIRNELHRLTDRGFLEQPYHSAGRIPSDRGYEFFAERVLDREYDVSKFVRHCENLFKKSHWENLAEMLSSELGVLGVIDDCKEDEIYKEGLDDLIDNLSWDSPREVKEVIRDFETLDKRLDVFDRFLEEDTVKVFVGRSPITNSRNLSVIAAHYLHSSGRVVLIAIGPKRMDYQKVIAVFKNLQ